MTIRSRHKTPEESFAARTEWQGDCLVWTGTRDTTGYGRISVGRGVIMPAHRYAYERHYGTVPKELVIDHKCFNRACTNVRHLRAVTQKQNVENTRGGRSNNTSGHQGVSWVARLGKWRVEVTHMGKYYYGGLFKDIDKAHEAAVVLRNKLFTHNDRDKKFIRTSPNPYKPLEENNE